MPPKKADHQRKSDVSAARFALKEDGHDADATASPDTTTNDNDNAGTSASPPQQQQAGSESGKKGSVAPEGGKASAPASPSEKKEGKDGHRDAVTIEVRQTLIPLWLGFMRVMDGAVANAGFPGPELTKVHHHEARKGRAAGQYADPG